MQLSLFSRIDPRDALIALNAVPGLSTRFPTKMMDGGVLPAELFSMTPAEISLRSGIAERVAVNLVSFPAENFVRDEKHRAERLGVRIITIQDADYPQRLKEIIDPPIVLYVKGRLPVVDEACIAVVGARDATLYGLSLAERFSRRFAELGVGVISGMARGIDTAGHKGALSAGGFTVAVLGCGADIPYPSSNRDLYARILSSGGGIISEFPIGTRAIDYNFPRRNRIVSALSLGTLVVEARARSGALITARLALEQGRDVFAIPGPADSSLSRGTHELIRFGAKLVLCAEDVLEDLPLKKVEDVAIDKEEKKLFSTPEEELLLNILEDGPCSLDVLASHSGLPVSTLMGLCLGLQLRKMIKELPGKFYELS